VFRKFAPIKRKKLLRLFHPLTFLSMLFLPPTLVLTCLPCKLDAYVRTIYSLRYFEYISRDRSILSRKVQHHSEYVTSARLYAMGERLMAPAFRAYCLWRFVQSLEARCSISNEGIYELLQLACTEIAERVREDPLQ
jgi:hypothetical protein